MAFALPTLLAQVDHILSADDDELSAAARSEQTKAAIERYSRDLPDEVTADVSGDAGKYYAISALTSWSEGFSRIITVEYPAATVASDETPVYLEPEDWNDDYWAANVRYLFLPGHAPAATEAMRIRYTAPYMATANAYDIPPAHFYAVCNLGAGLCAQAIAAKYSRTSDSTIAADSVDHLSRADQWSNRARELMRLYADQLGISGDDGTVSHGTGEFVDWDTAPGWPSGRRYLFHGGETR